jgi:hypothetical protein
MRVIDLGGATQIMPVERAIAQYEGLAASAMEGDLPGAQRHGSLYQARGEVDAAAPNGRPGTNQYLPSQLVGQYNSNLAQDAERGLMDSLDFIIIENGKRALHSRPFLMPGRLPWRADSVAHAQRIIVGNRLDVNFL